MTRPIPDTRPYLARRRARESAADTRRQVVFGYVVAVLALTLGLTGAILTPPSRVWTVRAWLTLAALGGLTGLAALVVPWTLAPAEALARRLFRQVGRVVMTVLLALVYVLFVTPVGLILKRRPHNPIRSWTDTDPCPGPGWEPKTCTTRATAAGSRTRAFVTAPFEAVLFFIRHKNLALVPLLILLILMGLALFFAQSSALAPLVYPLF